MDNKPFLLDLFTSKINIHTTGYIVVLEEKPVTITSIEIESDLEPIIHDAIQSIREQCSDNFNSSKYVVSIISFTYEIGEKDYTDRRVLFFEIPVHYVYRLHEELKLDEIPFDYNLKRGYDCNEFIRKLKSQIP